MSDDAIERKRLQATLVSSQVRDLLVGPGRSPSYGFHLAFQGSIEDYALWEKISQRLVNQGLTVYESESFHEEVMTSIVAGHEAEKQQLQDQLRMAATRISELEQQLSHANFRAEVASKENTRLVAENIQLGGLKRLLDELSGLEAPAGGTIPT